MDFNERLKYLKELEEKKKIEQQYQPTLDPEKVEAFNKGNPFYRKPETEEELEEKKKNGFFSNLKKLMGK